MVATLEVDMSQPTNEWFVLAAIVAAVTFCVHTFVGGRYAVRPLFAAKDLTSASRWLNYMCWHMVTVVLAIISTGFAATAVGWLSYDVAAMLTWTAASLSIVSVAVTLKAGISPWRFPASYLLGGVALAGLLGFACCW